MPWTPSLHSAGNVCILFKTPSKYVTHVHADIGGVLSNYLVLFEQATENHQAIHPSKVKMYSISSTLEWLITRPTKTETPPFGVVVTSSVTGYFSSGFHNLRQSKKLSVAAIRGKRLWFYLINYRLMNCNMWLTKQLPSLLLETCPKLHQTLLSSD